MPARPRRARKAPAALSGAPCRTPAEKCRDLPKSQHKACSNRMATRKEAPGIFRSRTASLNGTGQREAPSMPALAGIGSGPAHRPPRHMPHPGGGDPSCLKALPSPAPRSPGPVGSLPAPAPSHPPSQDPQSPRRLRLPVPSPASVIQVPRPSRLPAAAPASVSRLPPQPQSPGSLPSLSLPAPPPPPSPGSLPRLIPIMD
jgi:hypothetical protein